MQHFNNAKQKGDSSNMFSAESPYSQIPVFLEMIKNYSLSRDSFGGQIIYLELRPWSLQRKCTVFLQRF